MEFTRHASGVAKGGLTTGIIGTSLGALALLGTGANGLGNLLGGNGNNAAAANGAGIAEGMLLQAALNTNNGWGWGGPVPGPWAFGGSWGGAYGWGRSSCESDNPVTRYEADKDAQIAKLESELSLREANDRMQQENLKLYQYVDGRLRAIEQQICSQAVVNQATNDKIELAAQQASCCCDKTNLRIDQEAERRCCGDNAIVNYANATFYPQMIADITVGSTAVAQRTWNPLPTCGCGRNNG